MEQDQIFCKKCGFRYEEQLLNYIEVSTEEELKKAMKNGYQSISIKGKLAEEMEKKQEKWENTKAMLMLMVNPLFLGQGGLFKKESAFDKLMADLSKDYVIEKDPNGGFKCEKIPR